MLHNYSLRQFHRTSNGENPSRGFRDIYSGPWACLHGLNGKWSWCCKTTNRDNFMEFRTEKIDPVVSEMRSGLAYGQAHIGHMGQWPWRYRTTGLCNSIELRKEKNQTALSEAKAEMHCWYPIWQGLGPLPIAHKGQMGRWPWLCTTSK